MSALILRDECATQYRLGGEVFQVEPRHDACPGAWAPRGPHGEIILGGWRCVCVCHQGKGRA